MVRGLIPSSAFDPLTLFANGEQGAWYDPSDLTTLFQDSAGTTPVTTDGDPVGLMQDKSGNGNDATQSTSGAKPIYRTDGTLHWLEFDGFDDYLATSALASNIFSTASGMACVGLSTGSDSQKGILEESVAGTAKRLSMYSDRTTAKLLVIYHPLAGSGGDAETIAYADAWGGSSRVIAARVDALSIMYGYVNGVEENQILVDDDFSAATILTIGRQFAGGLYFGGNFYGAVVRGDVSTEQDIADVTSYLATKSGVIF